jgi:hypothetical protein
MESRYVPDGPPRTNAESENLLPRAKSTRGPRLILALASIEVVYPLGLLLVPQPSPAFHLLLFFVAFGAYLAAIACLIPGLEPHSCPSADRDPSALERRPEPVGRPRAARTLLWAGLTLALLLRVLTLATQPSLSDDLYRYIWDGRIANQGINPYRHPPDSGALASWRDDLWRPINAKDLTTPYPPGAEAIFAATYWLAGPSVKAQQVVASAGDVLLAAALIALLVVLRLPVERALIYALNPACLMQFSHSAHNDAWMVAFMLLALVLTRSDRRIPAAFALAGAVLIKFFGGVIAPALTATLRWRHLALAGLLVVGAFAPFMVNANPLRGVLFEARGARFNDSLYFIIDRVMRVFPFAPGVLRSAIVGGLLLAGIVAVRQAALRGLPPIVGSYVLIGWLILLLPVVEPWYALWILPFVALRIGIDQNRPRWWFSPSGGWLLFSGLAVLTELTYSSDAAVIWPLVRLIEYGPLSLLLALACWQQARDLARRHPADAAHFLG